jgi:hypothetical protein
LTSGNQTLTVFLFKIFFRLCELEEQLSSLGPQGATVDVIEEQQEIILNALKKLSKYNHHIQLFTQVTCQYSDHLKTGFVRFLNGPF